MTGRLVIVREGHGEQGAIERLIARVAKSAGLIPSPIASIPESIRHVVTGPESALAAAEIAARYSPNAVLITADCDDMCPRDLAPQISAALRQRSFPFPIATVLFYREYETLAVSIADRLNGATLQSPGGTTIATLSLSAPMPNDPEAFRDAKGWIKKHLMGGQSYKPTTHQLPLTNQMSIDDLRTADLSSFRRLETAIRFLGSEMEHGTSNTYPA